MNETKLSELSELYLAALRTHFEQGQQAGSQVARGLGDQAVAIGLETLDLVKIHEKALATLVPPDCAGSQWDNMTRSAAMFFTEAITPIEKTHQIVLEANVELHQLNKALVQRTLDLAEANHELQQGIAQHQAALESLKTSDNESVRLLEESRQLQKHLQDMAHQMLTAQEDERKRMSLTLQDEIAQTLLGIHVRLLALDKEVSASTKDFKKEIATTQQLVEKSVKTINRFAGDLGIQREK